MWPLIGRWPKKIIYHVGAWAGNFGDSILQDSIRRNLEAISPWRLEFKYINCQQVEFTAELIKEINDKGDLLLVGGGGLIFHRPQDNSRSGWQWNIDVDLIDMLRIPLVIDGVGYNQFEYDPGNFISVTNCHLKKVVDKAVLFSVRNSGTREELAARGCASSKIAVIPDSGMFIKARRIHIPGLRAGALKIGFNWTTDREDQTFPAPFQTRREEFLDRCVETLNHAIRKFGAQVVYIGHMSRHFDAAVIGALKSRLISPPLVIDELFENLYPASIENAKYIAGIYKQMDVVLGMRGHANIVAFGQNTPPIGLGTHRKIRFFLEDIGRSRYFFDAREGRQSTAAEMTVLLDEVIQNRTGQKHAMKRELEKQRKIFMAFNRKVIDAMKARPEKPAA